MKHLKVILALLLVLCSVFSFAACKEEEGNASQAQSSSAESSQQDECDVISDVPNESSVPDESSTPDAPAKQAAVGTVKTGKNEYYEFTWIEGNDGTAATLEFAECVVATDAEMQQMGLSGDLIYKHDVTLFDVTYTAENGTYTAKGNISGAKIIVEGESKAQFIDMMKQNLDDSKLDQLTARALDGEVFTNKEDIENFIWEFDTKIEITFTITDNKLNISQIKKSYTAWGFMYPCEEITYVENGVRTRVDEYENGELDREECDSNGEFID